MSWVSDCENLAQAANLPAKHAANFRKVDPFLRLAAEEMGVPYPLLVGMAHVESRFNTNAVSPVGAQGFMQFMPATGAAMAKELGISYRPFDAQSSARMGALYMQKLLRRFRGNMDLAIAGYNAGAGAVEKYGGIPPFAETMAFVPAVKRAMRAHAASRLRCLAVACPPDSSCAPSIIPRWRMSQDYGYSGPGSSPGRQPRPSSSPGTQSASKPSAGAGLVALVVLGGLIFAASERRSA